MNEDQSEIHNGIAWAIIFALVAIIMGVIALATVCPRTDLSIDYMGVIVGILSLLVTALIGWQIFNLIKIDKLNATLMSAKEEIEKAKDEMSAEVRNESAESAMIHLITLSRALNLRRADETQLRLAYALAAKVVFNQLSSKSTTLIESAITVLVAYAQVVDGLGLWDKVFNIDVSKTLDGIFTYILEHSAILNDDQREKFILLNFSRKHKKLHESLRQRLIAGIS